jgi:hypothetical protein
MWGHVGTLVCTAPVNKKRHFTIAVYSVQVIGGKARGKETTRKTKA